jgi:hypothetical protein
LIEPDVGSTAHMVGAQMSKLRTRLLANSMTKYRQAINQMI